MKTGDKMTFLLEALIILSALIGIANSGYGIISSDNFYYMMGLLWVIVSLIISLILRVDKLQKDKK
jgi:hypothetical protein